MHPQHNNNMIIKKFINWAPGGRDQEDSGLKPAWANNSTRPYLEKPFTKIGLVE
jgi:hypothetical protein